MHILNHWTIREVLASLSLGVKLSEIWHMANPSDHYHDQEQAMSITLKMPRCCPFLVSPSTPESLAKGSFLLHYILAFAILKFLMYSEYKTFLIPVIQKHLSLSNKQLPFSLQEMGLMQTTFPPHTQSPMLCSQQVPMRGFRSENEFCCLSVCALS